MSGRWNAVARTLAASAVALALIGSGTAAAVDDPSEQITFATQQTGTYAGMPLFDGVPEHLDAYLEALVNYAGLEASANWANGRRGDFTIPTGPNAGKVVPGAMQFDEGIQGVSTDFPAPIAMGQTWNADLVGQIGEVIAEENLYKESFTNSISAFNPLISAALQDIRPNPLSGRLDEGFGEDPQHASVLIDEMSRGLTGIDEEANPDGFWAKSVVDTKHFTAYAAQWFRRTGNIDVSSRALMEYWSVPAMDGFESGAIDAFLTTYGRTNGVPNSISPLIAHVQGLSPWGGMYSTPDNGAENRLHVPNAYSNGFDIQYAPTWGDATALFAIADAGSIAATGRDPLRNAELIQRAQNGTYGVSEEDIFELAKKQMSPLVRMGLFNERDENGLPVDYPFVGLSAASTTPIDATVPAHQSTALQAAQESIVLLKNDDLLPLSKDASLAVVGPLSDARFRTTRAIASPNLPNSGLTPVQGIDAVSEGDITKATDGNVVRFLSVSTGNYLTLGAEASPTLNASTPDPEAAATFEAFAWGQGAYGYRSTENGKWLRYGSGAVTVDQTVDFGGKTASTPYRLRPIDNGDGTVSFVVESYSESFGGGFETRYYTNGRYLTIDPATGRAGVTGPLTDATNAEALRTDAAKFVVETTQTAGTQAVAADENYAVVVVGSPARNSAGEGADRSDLALGADQYELVKTVANAYPGRTVVVVSTVSPVLMGQIQNNSKVAAVVQAPDAGEYGNYALGQVLFGDYAPTGRLTQTWYASMNALPAIDSYSVPEGENITKTLASLDPRFTVDMTNGDPVETELTYKYTDAYATYPFGYGLSYSTFAYGDLQVQQDGGSFSATVDVTNTGDVTTSDVVQLYAANENSTYGDAAPKRQLVAFEKVEVPAGATVQVTLQFDADALAVWDVNVNEMTVEPGTYRFEVGRSSRNILRTVELDVAGDALAVLDAVTAPANVFDHSFDASDVTYREASKANTVQGLNDDELVSGYYVVASRAAGAWTALNDVNLGNAASVTLSVGSTNPAPGRIELRLDSPTGTKIAEVTVDATGPSDYVIPGAVPAGDIPVRELAYTTVSSDVVGATGGVHDVYLVFSDRDLRVQDLQITTAPVSKDALDAAIAAASALEAGDYTPDSFALLTEALDAATAVSASVFATQAEVDAATQALTAAQAALVAVDGSTFTDVPPSHPFHADITWLADEGITTGYADGSFRPLGSVNRDAMAAFLFRLTHPGEEAPACTAAPFSDVATSHPFCAEIAWLKSSGIASGYADGTFRPSAPVARDAMAAFIYRAVNGDTAPQACTSAPFVDVPTTQPFCGQIAWMKAEGLANGWSDGTYRPGASIERQAMAAFLHRLADSGKLLAPTGNDTAGE